MKASVRYTLILLVFFFIMFISFQHESVTASQVQSGVWKFQSIDTMKYSRDLSRQVKNDPSFDTTIDQQIHEIAMTGATYVAIDTPYDEEFLPVLKRWVSAARKYHLHVWFRGNFAGWEGWFNYDKITRDQHLALTKDFITNNSDLFADGDVFTACPECENGGPGDPRQTGDVNGFRKFMIIEYEMTSKAFKDINKNVISNYDSMNADVAKLIMDRQTTEDMGGVVTIDHYVATDKEMDDTVNNLAQNSGGKIVIGEFGAPIPDISGNMTEQQQATWVNDMLHTLANNPNVIGVNYWTSVGGTTALWDADGNSKAAVNNLTMMYSFHGVQGKVVNNLGTPITTAVITLPNNKAMTVDNYGSFTLPYLIGTEEIQVSAKGYDTKKMKVNNNSPVLKITLQKTQESFFEWLHLLFSSKIVISF